MAARAAEFAFLVVQLMAAARTPAPVLAGVSAEWQNAFNERGVVWLHSARFGNHGRILNAREEFLQVHKQTVLALVESAWQARAWIRRDGGRG